jgi:hypothetical protein
MIEKKRVRCNIQVDKNTTCLQSLRNIGPALEAKLQLIGIHTVEDFMKSDPEELYHRLRSVLRQPVDRCVLYCFLGAKLDLPWPQCKKFCKARKESSNQVN